jgi:hypothetical protein
VSAHAIGMRNDASAAVLARVSNIGLVGWVIGRGGCLGWVMGLKKTPFVGADDCISP